MRFEATLDGPQLNRAIDSTLGCLRNNLRSTGEGRGWYHYLDDLHPGVTASAVGLFTFAAAGRRFERSADVVRFLVGQQIVEEGPHNGGWAVRTTNGVPVVEATAWVVRALSLPGIAPIAGDALTRGVRWMERNQNTDSGWGSYLGQRSRVFHTALTMLALHESSGNPSVIARAQEWLIDAKDATQPAWGPLPGSPPTLLHTSFAILALIELGDPPATSLVQESCQWIFDRLRPGEHVEEATTVEEYSIPLSGLQPGREFQNSLPHFAGPIALTALLRAGFDPLEEKIFSVTNGILGSQQSSGTWVLPRSPTRPSIWAIWPFVVALSTARTVILPTPAGRADLIHSGCCVAQSENAPPDLTRRLLLRNGMFDWARRRKVAILLYLIAAITTGFVASILIYGEIGIRETAMALIFPVLLLVFQLAWDRRQGSSP